MAGGINVKVGAELNDGDVDRTVRDLTSKVNKMGAEIARQNKIKFNPVDKAALDDLRKLEQQFNTLLKINASLRQRMRATGQEGASFTAIDWNRIYPESNQRGRAMRHAYDYVTAGTGFSGRLVAPPAPPAPPRAPGGGGGGGGGRFPGQGIVEAGLNASGPVGGVVGGSIRAGMSGGFMAGLGGLFGGLAALGVGKVIGGIMNKKDAAENELIGYDTLKRQLGDVNVSFEVLKYQTREAAKALDISFDASQRLTSQFIKLANVSGEGSKSVYGEITSAGGLARSFGVDPSVAVGLMGQLRASRITSNETESKRFAITLGEAIAKSGTFAKADEVMQAVGNFAATQTRMGMGGANVYGYTGMLAGAVRSGIPGLDVGGAASLLGTVNSAVIGGGRAGEASKNFILATIGRQLGLNPIQTMIMQEQGAFGTGAGTFGQGSAYALFAERYRTSIPGAAASSSATNLQMLMQGLQSRYAGRPDIMLSAMSGLFGTNTSQSMALSLIAPMHLGGMASRLQRLGINTSEVKASGISALGQVEASGMSDAEKDARFRAIARQEQESTPGSEARRTREAVENLAQSYAEHLIPLTTSIRDGILFMAGGGKSAPSVMMGKIADLEFNEKAAPLLEKKKQIEEKLKFSRLDMFTNDPEQLASAKKKRAELEAELSGVESSLAALGRQRDISAGRISGVSGGSAVGEAASITGWPGSGSLASDSWLRGELLKTDEMLGLPLGTSAAQIAKESSYNAGAIGPQTKYGRAMGLAQIMPATLATMSQRFGRQMDPFNPRDAVMMHREIMRENAAKFGKDSALAAYNGGWDQSNWSNPETTNYTNWIKSNAASYSSPIYGAGAGRGSAEAYVTLIVKPQYENGKPAGPEQRVRAGIGRPVPAGVTQ